MTCRRSLRALVMVAVLLGAGACNPPPRAESNAVPGDLLGHLPECLDAPAANGEPVEGAEMPPDATVTEVNPEGPLISMTAYVPLTPVDIREHYEGRDDLSLLIIEDEIYESEMLVSNGTHRTYVKALASCRTASRAFIVVAEERNAENLPVPAGAVE